MLKISCVKPCLEDFAYKSCGYAIALYVVRIILGELYGF